MPNDQLDGLLHRLVSGTGEITSAELEQLRSAIFGTPENENPAALADIAATLDAPEDDRDENASCELQSAGDYLARVASEDQAVPASLLRLAGAAPVARATVQLVNRRSRLAGLRRQQVLGWGSAIAATVLAGISGYVVHDFVVRNPAAPATAVLPSDVADARAPQAANSGSAITGALPPQESGSSANTPVPTMAVNPPIPTTSHAVQAGDYPPDSVALQEQGTVKVRYLVLKTGAVEQCQVENSSGHPGLDDAACAMVKRWFFKPASLSDGTPVDWWLDASVVFNLVDGTAHSTPPQPPAVANAQSGTTPGRGLQTKNEALVKAITDMNAAARAQNWALALQKAQEADAIKDDKPAALNAPIHAMIISAAINAHDYAAAMAELDREIASGEGNKTQELKQALGVAIMAKNKEKTDQYAKELGGNLDNEKRLFIAISMMNSGQLQEALDYAQPALQGNPSEAALKFEEAVYFKMNNLAGRRAALEELVANYPKLEYWHDLLQLAGNDKGLSDDQIMDIYRLRLAVGDLKTDADFQDMAREALVAGYATEAKGVLEKAQAENLLSGERDQRLVKMATDRAAQDGAAIADLQKRAGSDADLAVKLGLLYWSTGKDKEAEDSIRAAMASGHLADPDAAQMALGHVLLSEGKNQEAIAVFRSVRGPNASSVAIASMWASYAVAPALSRPPQAPAVAAAQSSTIPTRGLQTKNEALVKAITEMNAAAQGKRWAECLEKAKEADAIKDDKPAALNPPIHNMIVSCAGAAKDYVTAMSQLDQMIAAGEGGKALNLKQALDYATLSKNQEKIYQYESELTRLFTGRIPSVALTSHAVTANDYPPVSVRLQEQGKVGIRYLVKEDGTVGDCDVIMSSGKARLDNAACAMAKRSWKFKPATQDGNAVAEFLTAEVIFELK